MLTNLAAALFLLALIIAATYPNSGAWLLPLTVGILTLTIRARIRSAMPREKDNHTS